jgi:excisionase family DNA binding protein
MSTSTARSSEIREVMDIRQASDYLGISPDSLYRYASEGFIPAFKLGNRWRFRRSRLEEWMDTQSGIDAVPVPAVPIPEPKLVKPRQKKPVRGTGVRTPAAPIDAVRTRSGRSGTRGSVAS